MRKLWYIPLESYQARYTLQLTDWSERVFKRRGIEYEVIQGERLDTSEQIVTGAVLDAHGRSYYALSQMMTLVKKMRAGEITNRDAIFFEDMFHPGIESLGYIFNQVDRQYIPDVWVRCLAQTIDPDDFVHTTGMTKWMRRYEEMVAHLPGVSILATNEEMVTHLKIAGITQAPLYNISGLSFGKAEVLERVGNHVNKFQNRPDRVVFAARFDREKQPHFFMDVVERLQGTGITFEVLQGGPLRSNDPSALKRAREMQKDGKLIILENLTKDQYYRILNSSRVLFNCALQDWVSNTVSEADTLGCNVVYPAYRSFPETFANDPSRLYIPWSLDDAVAKILHGLQAPNPNMGKISDWTDSTIDRMLDIMSYGTAHYTYNRDENDYRSFVAEAKY